MDANDMTKDLMGPIDAGLAVSVVMRLFNGGGVNVMNVQGPGMVIVTIASQISDELEREKLLRDLGEIVRQTNEARAQRRREGFGG